MTAFRFLHAADIHLDSPLHGLSRYDGIPLDDVRGATRAAFDNLVNRALAEAVDFVIIAGDLFDGDWKDMGTGLYFARAMGRLDQAGIPVFLLAGNHDAASVLSRTVPWPDNVKLFSTRKPETHLLETFGVAVHGQSFANAAVTDNLVLTFPQAHSHFFNIGVLHTALGGRTGHVAYAPCSIDDLRRSGYDYWALGHVHAQEVVSREPYVVFPGNIQGRSIRETGPKGAIIVEVADRQVVAVEPIELDVIRWGRIEIECSELSSETLLGAIRSALASAQAGTDGRPLIVRLALIGETRHAGSFRNALVTLRDDVRAVAAAISPELWLEKIVEQLREPHGQRDPIVAGEDFAALIATAPDDVELAALVASDLTPFLDAIRGDLDESEGELRAKANSADWPALIRAASDALRPRLEATS
ncbi:metallophosphoesterase family protein [Rhizobium beringeri]|uniref:metallophosphoesterase family protein n=1 Tax=Rhizobium TaxID=379 RepID=UPI001C8FF154|nr:DNA repair exonuclease [Rhizobium leguminosarum]MBY2925845.1 DNA repair exonuclease [Rhizobium leguminosarum]MBY2937438.1 DNA repair exonuclease [Rhizobium leguminosarum]